MLNFTGSKHFLKVVLAAAERTLIKLANTVISIFILYSHKKCTFSVIKRYPEIDPHSV